MVPESNSISFIVSCYNEENNIKNTINEINLAVNNSIIEKYEIIIVDDGSIDQTLQIAEKLQDDDTHIKIIRNLRNIGLGGAVKKGLIEAKLDKVMFLPGDNSHQSSEIKKLINNDENNDLVLTYYSNLEVRTFVRNYFTKIYTPFLNLIFGLNLPYYNGIGVYKRSILKDISINTNSFTWQIEVLLKLFKTKNINYVIVPTKLEERTKGKSKAFRIKNSIYVIYSITRLFIIKFFLKKINSKIKN